jgi:hypothetical protein
MIKTKKMSTGTNALPAPCGQYVPAPAAKAKTEAVESDWFASAGRRGIAAMPV